MAAKVVDMKPHCSQGIFVIYWKKWKDKLGNERKNEMNRERRRVIGNIFADAAKYILTAGAIGSFLAGKFTLLFAVWGGVVFAVLALLAYFITPQDKKE